MIPFYVKVYCEREWGGTIEIFIVYSDEAANVNAMIKDELSCKHKIQHVRRLEADHSYVVRLDTYVL